MLCADNSVAIFNLGFVANLPVREPLTFYACVSLIEQSLTMLAVDNVISPAVFSVLSRWVSVFRQKCGILLHDGLSGYRPPQHDEREDFKRAIASAVPTSCHYYPWFALGTCIGAYFTYPEELSTMRKSPVEMIQAAIRMMPDKWTADVPLLVDILELSSDAYANSELRKTVERHAAGAPGNQRAFEGPSVFARIREIIAKRLEQSPPKVVISESGTGGDGLTDIKIQFDRDEPKGPQWDAKKHEFLIDGVVVHAYKRKAKNQFLVLEAFELVGWETVIDTPIDDSKQRTQTLKELNKLAPDEIIFRGDGTGEGIKWEKPGRKQRKRPAG